MMTMRTFDYSPFYRATVGFDRVFDLLDSVASQSGSNGYPPYNIEKSGDNAYKIVMAVAGFAEAELNVTQKENELLVTGQTAPNGQDDKQYLYRGIAGRQLRAPLPARRPCEGRGCEARQRSADDRAAARDPGGEEAPCDPRRGGQARADALTVRLAQVRKALRTTAAPFSLRPSGAGRTMTT